MDEMKTYDFDNLLHKQLKDKDFTKEYDALEEEFKLAREFIRLRKERNITQKELAMQVGTSQPAIARLESGNYTNLSLSFIRRVAKALNAIPQIHLKKL